MSYDRRQFMAYMTALGLGGTVFPGALYAQAVEEGVVTVEMIAAAEQLAGLSFSPEQRALMVEDLNERLEQFEALRTLALPNAIPPAFVFEPRRGIGPADEVREERGAAFGWAPRPAARPASEEDLAFASVAELAHLLKTREVTALELTKLSLRRLRQYDPVLQAVVTLTEERALAQAAAADRELAAGRWRGPLHGIPYGAKDLLAVRGYPTTWGAMPYRKQTIDADAAVVERLDAAGAILVAKLTLGALAWGDVWFGGQTKNPWNIEQGSSGSSAGPGAAVAAGLVPFAIGSETLGSIVSPATRNGITGHRPTFGRVSRYGAMTLSWTMDKLGPMARSAEDCALVFEAIRGADARDAASGTRPFPYRGAARPGDFRVGYVAEAFEEDEQREAHEQTLAVLRRLGHTLVPVHLPAGLPVEAMLLTLEVEAAAAFDALTREGGVDELVRQGRNTWPHVFRTARFVPAVEYVQANRARTLLMEQVAAALSDVEVFVSPTYGGQVLGITNLTGHPCVCVPNSFEEVEGQLPSEQRSPGSISFLGRLDRDAEVLALAQAYQEATDFHQRRPPLR